MKDSSEVKKSIEEKIDEEPISEIKETTVEMTNVPSSTSAYILQALVAA